MLHTQFQGKVAPTPSRIAPNLSRAGGVQKQINAAVRGDRILNALSIVGEANVAAAFRQNAFIYGTMGTKSDLVRGLKAWGGRLHGQRAAEEKGLPIDPNTVKVITRSLNLFDPGRRANEYIRAGYQMMDLYYGQAGTQVHKFRNPVIAEFVHHAMGFSSVKFNMQLSGREAYRQQYGITDGREGWMKDCPGSDLYNKLSATKEMSRIIRWGIKRFGGTLVFEGRELYYSQVFLASVTDLRDTDVEARDLFEYFSPGQSRAGFGRGTVIFQWKGVECVPTKMHFFSSWAWSNNGRDQLANMPKSVPAPAELTRTWSRFATAPNPYENAPDSVAYTLARAARTLAHSKPELRPKSY